MRQITQVIALILNVTRITNPIIKMDISAYGQYKQLMRQ